MLTPLDDELVHQIAETLDHPATSDRNSYDRYYFSVFDTQEETLCEFTLDGETGFGPFEFACIGPYRPYGFA